MGLGARGGLPGVGLYRGRGVRVCGGILGGLLGREARRGGTLRSFLLQKKKKNQQKKTKNKKTLRKTQKTKQKKIRKNQNHSKKKKIPSY